jgi:hypothetical protein
MKNINKVGIGIAIGGYFGFWIGRGAEQAIQKQKMERALADPMKEIGQCRRELPGTLPLVDPYNPLHNALAAVRVAQAARRIREAQARGVELPPFFEIMVADEADASTRLDRDETIVLDPDPVRPEQAHGSDAGDSVIDPQIGSHALAMVETALMGEANPGKLGLEFDGEAALHISLIFSAERALRERITEAIGDL